MVIIHEEMKCEMEKLKSKAKQAGAELGQAQLKLGLDFNFGAQLNLH